MGYQDSVEFKVGYRDFENGKNIEDNPYCVEFTSDLRFPAARWEYGWFYALRNDARKKQGLITKEKA